MQALNQMSSNMGTFVSFFSNINRLFCQVRWLERNLRNASVPLLLFCLGIMVYCAFLVSGGGGEEMPQGLSTFINDIVPILLVAGVIGLFMARRRMGGLAGGFQDVFFGNAEENGSGSEVAYARVDGSSPDLEAGGNTNMKKKPFVAVGRPQHTVPGF